MPIAKRCVGLGARTLTAKARLGSSTDSRSHKAGLGMSLSMNSGHETAVFHLGVTQQPGVVAAYDSFRHPAVVLAGYGLRRHLDHAGG